MKPLELAHKYMALFYDGGSLDSLSQLLGENFSFTGPFHQFQSASEYIESLKSDPPIDMQYTILHAYEDESSACLVYQFSKNGISTPMAQTFEVSDGKISRILLVFDATVFT